MSKFSILLVSSFALFATTSTAQEIDCQDAACIDLPGADDVQNFIPGIAALIGGRGILASDLLGGSTTTSTTSTN